MVSGGGGGAAIIITAATESQHWMFLRTPADISIHYAASKLGVFLKESCRHSHIMFFCGDQLFLTVSQTVSTRDCGDTNGSFNPKRGVFLTLTGWV